MQQQDERQRPGASRPANTAASPGTGRAIAPWAGLAASSSGFTTTPFVCGRGTGFAATGGGARTTLDSALDRVAILSTAGNTFDAGTVNVRYG